MDQFTLPLKLTCKISGKVVTYTSEEYVRKRLEKYDGNLKRMMDEFVCRDAKRGLKDQKTVTEIRAEAGVTFTGESGAEITVGTAELIDKVMGPPKVKYEFERGEPTPITKATAPRDSCFNPGWFLNKKSCGACAFASVCNYEKKRA